jgi:membrane protein YdbS with pleckstrin-like domain
VTLAMVLLGVATGIGLVLWWADNDFVGALVVWAVIVAAIVVVWLVVAFPYSGYQKDVCQQKAEGYGLERSQWSIRHGCRVYLPTGQLVPESRIRITSDGQIVVVDD